LKLKCDELLSNFAFKFNVCRYMMKQMIPHHQNAVNMAKTTLIFAQAAPGYDANGEGFVEGLLMDIIAGQNMQIQEMQGGALQLDSIKK